MSKEVKIGTSLSFSECPRGELGGCRAWAATYYRACNGFSLNPVLNPRQLPIRELVKRIFFSNAALKFLAFRDIIS